MMQFFKKWLRKESVAKVENNAVETPVKTEEKERKPSLLKDLETFLFSKYNFRFNVLTEQT